jgi:ribosomal 50S subunit-associated protein YjgA (DUF615 family)
MTFSATEKLREIKREIAMRRTTYPRWVAAKRLTQHDADRQIAILEAIMRDYEIEAIRENTQQCLPL